VQERPLAPEAPLRLGERGGPAQAGQGAAEIKLESTPWILNWGLKHDGTLWEDQPGVEVSAVFEDGQMSGSTGCHDYRSTYELRGTSSISMTRPVPTATGPQCTNLSKNEAAYFDVLSEVVRFELGPDTLTLTTNLGTKLVYLTEAMAAEQQGASFTSGFGKLAALDLGPRVDRSFAE
jgi:hypothetical protein